MTGEVQNNENLGCDHKMIGLLNPALNNPALVNIEL